MQILMLKYGLNPNWVWLTKQIIVPDNENLVQGVKTIKAKNIYFNAMERLFYYYTAKIIILSNQELQTQFHLQQKSPKNLNIG